MFSTTPGEFTVRAPPRGSLHRGSGPTPQERDQLRSWDLCGEHRGCWDAETKGCWLNGGSSHGQKTWLMMIISIVQHGSGSLRTTVNCLFRWLTMANEWSWSHGCYWLALGNGQGWLLLTSQGEHDSHQKQGCTKQKKSTWLWVSCPCSSILPTKSTSVMSNQ